MYLKILTFVFALVLTSVICKAQSPSIGPDYQEKAAGLELLKASRHFYTGAIFIGGGIIFDVAGLLSSGNVNGNGNGNNGNALTTLGDLSILTGFVYMFESYSHVGKAGKILMDERGFSLGTTNHGFGISYRF